MWWVVWWKQEWLGPTSSRTSASWFQTASPKMWVRHVTHCHCTQVPYRDFGRQLAQAPDLAVSLSVHNGWSEREREREREQTLKGHLCVKLSKTSFLKVIKFVSIITEWANSTWGARAPKTVVAMARSPGGNQVFESMVGALHSRVLVKEAMVVPTSTNQNPPGSERAPTDVNSA